MPKSDPDKRKSTTLGKKARQHDASSKAHFDSMGVAVRQYPKRAGAFQHMEQAFGEHNKAKKARADSAAAEINEKRSQSLAKRPAAADNTRVAKKKGKK